MKKKVVGISFSIKIPLNLKNKHLIKNQASTIQKSCKFFVLSGINRTRPIQASGKKGGKSGNMTSTTAHTNSNYVAKIAATTNATNRLHGESQVQSLILRNQS
jgi:hypothetical protein